MMGHEELKRRQSWSLGRKVRESLERIEEWYEAWDGDVYVAFSGGKDSTVLLDLVRSYYPDVPAVFNNTGLEFPEIVSFVRTFDNVVELRPAKPFHRVIKENGYPVVSKTVAHQLYFLQNPRPSNAATRKYILTGIKRDGTKTKSLSLVLAKKWRPLIDAPFKINDTCCDVLKKAPAQKYGRESGRVPYLGTMASDSDRREVNYKRRGCNYFGPVKSAASCPISFWTEKDVWEYIKTNSLPYSSIYDMGYIRTGCVFCMFGVHLEQKAKGTNRFIRLKQTHPKLWEYCMDKLGIRQVMNFIDVPTGDQEQQSLFV